MPWPLKPKSYSKAIEDEQCALGVTPDGIDGPRTKAARAARKTLAASLADESMFDLENLTSTNSIRRVPTGGWKFTEYPLSRGLSRWHIDCQLGLVMADVVQTPTGYDWRALPDRATQMVRGSQPTLELAQKAADQALNLEKP